MKYLFLPGLKQNWGIQYFFENADIDISGGRYLQS